MKAVEELLIRWEAEFQKQIEMGKRVDSYLYHQIRELKAAIEADRATSNPAAVPDQLQNP